MARAGDQLKTEDLADMLFHKNGKTDMKVITKSPSQYKYENMSDMVGELDFLIELARIGVKVYFYEHHKKYFLTNHGVITGSANYTPSGRYLNPESTFFFSAKEPTYKECLQDIKDALNKSEYKGDATVSFLKEKLEILKSI